MNNVDVQKPVIIFPCEWEIKLIGADEKKIQNAVSDIINDRTYSISPSNKSRTGKYVSIKVKLTLLSSEEKDTLYKKFNECKDVKFVL